MFKKKARPLVFLSSPKRFSFMHPKKTNDGNLKKASWKRKDIYKQLFLGFHVSFQTPSLFSHRDHVAAIHLGDARGRVVFGVVSFSPGGTRKGWNIIDMHNLCIIFIRCAYIHMCIYIYKETYTTYPQYEFTRVYPETVPLQALPK